MPGFLDSDFIVFTLFGYGVSLLELLGTASGYVCVWLTARGNVFCWPFGIINAVFFFLLFYGHNLYSDMLLQVYFFATSVYGWRRWTHPRTAGEADGKYELRVRALEPATFALLVGSASVVAVALGFVVSRIHLLLPAIFPEPAAFPFADTLVAVGSVVAQVLLSVKKRESWIIWICVDVLAATIYLIKGMLLMSVEYAVFCAIAISGLVTWNRMLRSYGTDRATEVAVRS